MKVEKIITVHSCRDCPYFNQEYDNAMFGDFIECKKRVFGLKNKLVDRNINEIEDMIDKWQIHPNCVLSDNVQKETLREINKLQNKYMLEDKDMAKILYGLNYSSYTDDINEFFDKYVKIYSVEDMEKLMKKYEKVAQEQNYLKDMSNPDDLLELWKYLYICIGWQTENILYDKIYIIYASY
jgi:hypothetical protein